MPDWLSIANLGGWAFAAIENAILLWRLFAGDIVQGKLLDRSLSQQEKALPAIEANTQTLNQIAPLIRDLKEAVDDLAREIRDLRLERRT